MPCRVSFFVFGDSGDGKTTLSSGEYAEYIAATRGVWEGDRLVKGRTRLYTMDGGGWQSVVPYEELGIVEVVDLRPFVGEPWEALYKASKGHTVKDGKWSADPDMKGIDLLVYEGAVAFCDAMMGSLRVGLATGKRVIKGRGQDVIISSGDVKMTGNNEAHYGTTQGSLVDFITYSQTIPGAEYDLIWTSTARRATDNDNNSLILGPQSIGKALTGELPRMFTYTLRLTKLPADPAIGRENAEHRLYIDGMKDELTPGVSKVLGNNRIPLDALVGILPKEGYMVPASLVGFVKLLEGAGETAKQAISARLKRAYTKGVKE